jgi:hypothetical protein
MILQVEVSDEVHKEEVEIEENVPGPAPGI